MALWTAASAEYTSARCEPITLTVRRLAVENPSAATSATLISVTMAKARIRLVPSSERQSAR